MEREGEEVFNPSLPSPSPSLPLSLPFNTNLLNKKKAIPLPNMYFCAWKLVYIKEYLKIISL